MNNDMLTEKENPFGQVQRCLILVVLLIFTANLAIFLNLPFLRQFLSVILLGLLPGWLLVLLFRLNHLEPTVKLVLSVGLSQAFLMFYGWLLNQASLYFGYSRPLSTGFLSIFISLALLVMTFIIYITNKEGLVFSHRKVKLNTTDKLIIGFSFTFPILSIFGTYLMNLTSNNIFLMGLLFLITVCTIFIIAFQNKLSKQSYPVIIFMFSISLVLTYALRSNHIIGTDAHYEYYLFQLTSKFQSWHLFESNNFNSCLSIMLLPAIYQSFLNINPEYLFKVFYPLLFSISPLVVYIISKKYMNNFYAFLASFFFMCFYNFQMTTAHARTNSAILFFILAIMVLFHSKINPFAKKGLFIIFTVATIVSHYSTTYVFFFVLILTWLVMELFLRLLSQREKNTKKTGILALNENSSIAGNPVTPDILPGGQLENQGLKRGITFITVVLFFVLLFVWYSQVTAVPFDSGVNFVYGTFKSLQNFFVLESRNTVPDAFGAGLGEKGIPHRIEFIFNWATIILMVLGVTGFFWEIIKRVKKKIGEESKIKSFFPRFMEMDLEYLFLGLVCIIILVVSVIFPMVSVGYDLNRIYLQMTSVLAVFFIFGGIFAIKYSKLKLSPNWLLIAILIPYFLCQTGFIKQIFGFPGSMVLNSKGKQYDNYYIYEQEISSEKWLKNKGELPINKICTDHLYASYLISPAEISALHINNQTLLLEKDSKIRKINDYIYLKHFNMIDGKLLNEKYKNHDIANYQATFKEKNKIYSNGGSEVYKQF
ncbi:hypothetical protein HX99_04235 [Peptococcaceae bacterium SCADC1_2_3]|nr:hypothetical protein DK28_0215455 [Peptococcaceae bacterium SCADC1_2_3]KFI36450.1 hypothetical protein HX99_04235 [Peptococcaceae bacterium SCADC1_2_3]KFI37701.1 hypothetical protein HY02_04310 [Peptococcaceae bacterium SCADC1_2_3]